MPDLRKFLSVLFLLLASCSPALAVNPNEVLDDPLLEQRARELSVQIRCVVCQNQSIDDSDAELARELRIIVREKLVEGLGDQQILDFLVARYGEFVLLKPPFNARTILLWAAPFVLLLAGVCVMVVISRRRTGLPESTKGKELNPEERERLAEILKDN